MLKYFWYYAYQLPAMSRRMSFGLERQQPNVFERVL